jgi:hypothetical protein
LILLSSCVVTLTLGISLINKYFSSKKEEEYLNCEARSNFYSEDVSNDLINEFEEEAACGKSYKRIKIKGVNQVWNVKTEFDPQCVYKGDLSGLSQLVSSNTRNCIVRVDRDVKTFVLGICSKIALINTHALEGSKDIVLSVSETGRVGAECKVYKNTIVDVTNRLDLENDLTLVALNGVLFRDITKHLNVGEDFASSLNGMFAQRRVNVKFVNSPTTIVSRDNRVVLPYLFRYEFPDHYPGACGMALIAEKNSGSCIIGIHVGAKSGDPFGYSTMVKKDIVMKGIEKLRNNSTFLSLSDDGEIRAESLDMPISKSTFRYEILHGVKYYGKVPGEVLIKQKSRLIQSSASEDVFSLLNQEFNYVPSTYMTKPLVTPQIIQGEYISPYNIALVQISKEKPPVDRLVLNDGINEYSGFRRKS